MAKTKEKEKKKPVQEIRVGRIRAAVWENETKNGALYNVTFSRLYRDDEGDWHDSTSFGRDDLPLVCKVADRVHSWIFDQAQRSNSQDASNEETSF